MKHVSAIIAALLAAVSFAAAVEEARPSQWANRADHNMAFGAAGLPQELSEDNKLWSFPLKRYAFGIPPTVHGDRLIVGVDGLIVIPTMREIAVHAGPGYRPTPEAMTGEQGAR